MGTACWRPRPAGTFGARLGLRDGHGLIGESFILLGEALAQAVAPAGRKLRQLAGAAQQVGVRCIRIHEAHDVGDRNAAVLLRAGRLEPFDGVARRNRSFLFNREVEATAAAGLETLDDLRPAKADAELEARHARLRDPKLRGADAEPAADGSGVFQQALNREILAKGASGQGGIGPAGAGQLAARLRKRRAPNGVVL